MKPKNGIVMLAGKPVEVRYDVVGLTSAQTICKAMGFERPNTWALADLPYDLGEEVVLLVSGINGARRIDNDPKQVTIEDVHDLLQEHFDYIAEQTEQISDEQEAMKAFQDAQRKLMEEIGAAVKDSLGFRRRSVKGGAGAKSKRKEGEALDA